MKPLTTELQDEETLRDLGIASVQIVHDLKNQLNGLKLYATFLRKRLEKADRPADELETLNKLLAGLERAATDMNTLVRLGRPLDLHRQPRTDLARLLETASEGRRVEIEAGDYLGEFDTALLSAALKEIGESTHAAKEVDAQPVRLRHEETQSDPSALIEWRGFAQAGDGVDIFKSFAGATGLRLALAARVIRAHGGEVAHEAGTVRARLPLSKG